MTLSSTGRKLRRALIILPILFVSCAPVRPQGNGDFDINLVVDYSAAEQTVKLLDEEFVSTERVAELRGNRIAASTTGLVADRYAISSTLKNYLDSLKYRQIIRDDVYKLEEAREHVAEIRELLDEMRRRNFNRRVVATVAQIFPSDVKLSVMIPVYVVALGHENVDAYVRRIVWHGDVPQFVGEDEGELTIVINLAQAARYGGDLEARFVTLLGVVAHEVFHAAFGAFKDQSRTWKRYYRNHRRPFDKLLDLTQNEGIAYYLSLDQQGRGYLPRDWNRRIRETFDSFNASAEELLSDTLTPYRAQELIRTANLSGYWESYGAMTGMFIAREIDLRLGRAALIETIANTPADMFEKYLLLTERDNNLPRLSPKVIAGMRSR